MESGFNAGMILFFGIYLFVMLLISVYFAVVMWKVFVKGGEEGWASLIPFYNIWVQVRIANLSTFWFIMMFVPFMNFVAMIYLLYSLHKAFDDSDGFAILGVFFPFITMSIIAFSDKY